jgi:regulator of protease activity HflC (stomatin/prohibitin superfamily)
MASNVRIADIDPATIIHWTMTPEMHAYAEQLIAEQRIAARDRIIMAGDRAQANANRAQADANRNQTAANRAPTARQPRATVHHVANGAQMPDPAEVVVPFRRPFTHR